MTKKQENETSKELGMDNKKTSGKSGKLKISVSAIRKGEKKTEGKRSNTRRRANNHSNDHSKRRRPAAQVPCQVPRHRTAAAAGRIQARQ